MPANIEGSKFENIPGRTYDERVEARLGVLEKDVAVMQNNFATQESGMDLSDYIARYVH
ncbi:hypothetical protein RugamoR57_39030 [Duganella caerulea]|uniref:hypothetical protein n=1 Tax=Duganella caerulea TaxID=2885762 RepID=UPI0030EB02E9